MPISCLNLKQTVKKSYKSYTVFIFIYSEFTTLV